MTLKKPRKLDPGDPIATVSISHGWAGDDAVLWKYELGKKILEERYHLQVIAAPNSMRGSRYLAKNPQARAEDFLWAFENPQIKAIIANVGGNDSITLLPFIDTDCIKNHPKIFVGYSDIQNMHLLCYKAGLSTFYGPNLLSSIAEAQGFHAYSDRWFRNVFFETEPIGVVEPSDDWTYEEMDYENKEDVRTYYPNEGYCLFQGEQSVTGRLFGGHTGMMDLEGTAIELRAHDFEDVILFIEDIPAFFSPDHIAAYFRWLGDLGAIRHIKGILIGKTNQAIDAAEHRNRLLNVIAYELGRPDLPILYGLNFGHSSPMCILPYGAVAKINCEKAQFSIVESGVC